MKRIFALLFILLFITACGSAEPTVTPSTDTAVPTDTPSPTTTPMPQESRVTITAADGLEMAGRLQIGQGEGPRPTVILLHMLQSNFYAWDKFAGPLNEAGYTSFSLDMRGHGKTRGKMNWALVKDDILLVRQYLADQPYIDGERIGIVGGSIGANMALVVGAAEPQIKTVVLLSPGLNYVGVETMPPMKRYGQRPILIVASENDPESATSSEQLIELAEHADSTLQMYEKAGHGTNMFSPQPELAHLIIEWLNNHLE